MKNGVNGFVQLLTISFIHTSNTEIKHQKFMSLGVPQNEAFRLEFV